jgi:hypothetical protein
MSQFVNMNIVPAGKTIAELEKKAEECENKAKQEVEPLASQLKQEASLFREWVKTLKSRKWTS